MASFGSTASNLSLSVSSGVMAHTIGYGMDTLQSKLANWGRDNKVKFYWDFGMGGGVFDVMGKDAMHLAAGAIATEVVNQYKSLIGGKTVNEAAGNGAKTQLRQLLKAQGEEESKYGKILIKDGNLAYLAIDDWGNVCYDALMLAIPVDKEISVSGRLAPKNTDGKYELVPNTSRSSSSDKLVWYDTTALVSVSSDKNILINRVQGRDYSRKELVSNGDIKFSISGHITSNMPDIYPTQEVQKFRQIMQYKGVVEVNNEILDQWGITKVVITSFSLPPREGNKSTQDYSFECVAVQPDKEADVQYDTLALIDYTLDKNKIEDDDLTWKNLLAKQLEALKSQSADLVAQGASLSVCLLDNI